MTNKNKCHRNVTMAYHDVQLELEPFAEGLQCPKQCFAIAAESITPRIRCAHSKPKAARAGAASAA
jgi:hypothetical protein